MRLYVNAGFGRPLGPGRLKTIKDLGFSGVRQDVPDWAKESDIHELVGEFKGSGLAPLFLMSDAPTPDLVREQLPIIIREMLMASVVGDVEIGNETDSKNTPEQFRASLLAAVAVKGMLPYPESPWIPRLISGGITSLNGRRLDYLRRANPAGTGIDAVGFHTYRPEEARFEDGTSIADGLAKLKVIAGRLPLWNTEIGFHTLPTTVRRGPFGLFKKTIRYTDDEVANLIVAEAYSMRAMSCHVMSVYQLDDGGPYSYDPLDHYGLLRADGTKKPVAGVISYLSRSLA